MVVLGVELYAVYYLMLYSEGVMGLFGCEVYSRGRTSEMEPVWKCAFWGVGRG